MSAATGRRPSLEPQVIERAVELMREDEIVLINTRWRQALVSLHVEGRLAGTLVIDRGVLRTASTDEHLAAPEIVIDGSEQQWRSVLDGLHGGLHRAWRYRLLEFGGDPAATFDLWKTIWRLGDALVAAAKDDAHAA